MNSVLVAILAAGESKRMGRPKLCLPWNGTTVLGHILSRWREAGAEKLLVVQPRDASSPVALELDRLGVPAGERVATSAPERGMMGSIITAAGRALEDPSLTHLVIALGDQPQVREETCRALIEACAIRPEPVIRTVFQGKPGHPLALPARLLAELSATSSATLRDFLSLPETPAWDLTCPDSGILLDLDTPNDYAQALSRTE